MKKKEQESGEVHIMTSIPLIGLVVNKEKNPMLFFIITIIPIIISLAVILASSYKVYTKFGFLPILTLLVTLLILFTRIRF